MDDLLGVCIERVWGGDRISISHGAGSHIFWYVCRGGLREGGIRNLSSVYIYIAVGGPNPLPPSLPPTKTSAFSDPILASLTIEFSKTVTCFRRGDDACTDQYNPIGFQPSFYFVRNFSTYAESSM